MKNIQMDKVITEFLKKNRLTLKDLSQKTNIPYSTLYSWCDNRPPKDITKAKLLADYMEISLDELLFASSFEQKENILYEGYIKILIEKDKND